MSKTENILLEYQKTIPKSLRIITNISHTDFFRGLDYLDKLEELSEDKIAMFINENLWRFPISNIFSKTQNTKLFPEIMLQVINIP